MKLNINNNIRWLLLLPLSFLSSLATIIILAFSASSLFYFFGEAYINVFIAIASICIVSAWLVTAYFLAPKHKETTLWVFYFIGSIIASAIAFIAYEETRVSEDKIMVLVFLVTSLVYGFLLSLKLQKTSTLHDFINREIKTTHL